MDSKTKKEAIITGVLIVALAVFLLTNLRKKPSSKGKHAALNKEIKITAKSIPTKSVKANNNIIALQHKRAQLSWGRDPFSFANIKRKHKGRTLLLKGISLGKDGRGYAFINDEIVTTGSVVSGYKVMEVQRDKVLLRKGGDSFYLGMPEE